MHSFAAAAAFSEKQERGEKNKRSSTQNTFTHKDFLTFQFNLNVTWLSREVHRVNE